jgi:hypothetical protein
LEIRRRIRFDVLRITRRTRRSGELAHSRRLSIAK